MGPLQDRERAIERQPADCSRRCTLPMKTFLRSILFLTAFILVGCRPEERFWWSPDGSQAVVAAGGRLYLTTADGELDAPLSDELLFNNDLPRHISWLPDGTGFVLHRIQRLPDWKAARSALPPDEVAEIERRALAIPGLVKAAAAMSKDIDGIEPLLQVVSIPGKDLMTAAFYCSWQSHPTTIEADLRALPKGAEILAGIREETAPFSIHEICLIKVQGNQTEGAPKSIVRSIRPVILPAVSPKAPVVAYCRILDDDKTAALEVSTLDGQARLSVGSSSSGTFDWTSDGRSLVFSAPVNEGETLLQSIRRSSVVQDSGALVAGDLETTDLAIGIAPTPPRVCALPDGRILFSSQPATLPAKSSGFDPAPRLYLISVDGVTVNAVPTAPGDLPANLGFFVPSPDGKRVAVVESDTDAVAVIDLTTGKTDIVSPAHPKWECRTMPAWKSATELTFAGLESSAGNPRWMSWSPNTGVRSIGKTWAPDATRDWLNEKKESKNPAGGDR